MDSWQKDSSWDSPRARKWIDEYMKAAREAMKRDHRVIITIHPSVASGAPCLNGVRVKDLYDRIIAGDSIEAVATAFGLPPDDVGELCNEEWREVILAFDRSDRVLQRMMRRLGLG